MSDQFQQGRVLDPRSRSSSTLSAARRLAACLLATTLAGCGTDVYFSPVTPARAEVVPAPALVDPARFASALAPGDQLLLPLQHAESDDWPAIA